MRCAVTRLTPRVVFWMSPMRWPPLEEAHRCSSNCCGLRRVLELWNWKRRTTTVKAAPTAYKIRLDGGLRSIPPMCPLRQTGCTRHGRCWVTEGGVGSRRASKLSGQFRQFSRCALLRCSKAGLPVLQGSGAAPHLIHHPPQRARRGQNPIHSESGTLDLPQLGLQRILRLPYLPYSSTCLGRYLGIFPASPELRRVIVEPHRQAAKIGKVELENRGRVELRPTLRRSCNGQTCSSCRFRPSI